MTRDQLLTALLVDDPRHGTMPGFSAGCRCRPCRDARNTYERRRRKLRQVLGVRYAIDATGTQRRIQALMALGWRAVDIATECGWVTGEAVHELLKRRSYVERTTAATVRAAYDRLSMTPGPSSLTRRRAARNGWPPPLAWDDDGLDDPDAQPYVGGVDNELEEVDEVAISEAMTGRRPIKLTKTERIEAVRRLSAAGFSEQETARRLFVHTRAVSRDKAQLRRTGQQEAA